MKASSSGVRAYCGSEILLLGFLVFTSGQATRILSAQPMPGRPARAGKRPQARALPRAGPRPSS